MAIKITRDILESYLHCRYKAFLKGTGQQGVRSDYEALLVSLRDEVRRRATESVLARHQEGEVVRNIVSPPPRSSRACLSSWTPPWKTTASRSALTG